MQPSSRSESDVSLLHPPALAELLEEDELFDSDEWNW